MPHKALTHKDLARQLGVSETTIKSYRRKFPGCIPVANQGKPIRFTGEALAVCKRIRDFFELGMSIPDVRARLSSEFPWVGPEACLACLECSEPEAQSEAPLPDMESQAPVAAADLGQDLSLIVGNLAKSVISLSQQQSALFKRLDGLEAKMEAALKNTAPSAGQEARPMEPGPESPPGAAPTPPAPAAAAAGPAVRLADKLDGIERSLEQTMGLLGNYVEAMQDLVQAAPLPAPGQSLAGAAPGGGQELSEEYLRSLAFLPLVYRNEQGDLVHLGGRSRGAYTLNDLKAVFAQAHNPPEHYVAYWHVEKGQSWFVLEQPESQCGRAVFMLIRPVRAERGMELAQIAELLIDGAKQPPMTLYHVIQQLLG